MRLRGYRHSRLLLLAFGLTSIGFEARQSTAETLAPAFTGSYSLFNLGSVAGVPGPYGGLTLLNGDTNQLLIGGNANNPSGAIYSIGVTRGTDGHITGFTGTAALFATAPQIDGGLAYAPNGVLLYTGYNNNVVGEIKPGSSTTDKTVSLGGLVTSSVGSLGFVPSYAPGAGGLKIASYNGGGFYDATFSPDGSGTYDITSATLKSTTGNGPEGFIYVTPGSPVFSSSSMLISEYGAGRVSAYTVDAGGNPIVASRQDFITGLSGAEGAFLDPVSGDFLFSTFGSGNQIIEVRGFAIAVPEPSSLVMTGMAALTLAGCGWRRRRAAA